MNFVKSEFVNLDSQLDVLTDILTRDGRSIARHDWFARLYENEINVLEKRLKKFDKDLNEDPEHFGDPLKSFYSIFSVFTMEGWSEVPAIIAQNTKPLFGLLTKLYFVFIVVTGGIFGLSLVNSIFVEAMLSDNTDDIQKKVDLIDRKLDRLISNEKL